MTRTLSGNSCQKYY